jgi:hypothetical protein
VNWNEEREEEINKWLKRLEIIPIVLFTIKGEGKLK